MSIFDCDRYISVFIRSRLFTALALSLANVDFFCLVRNDVVNHESQTWNPIPKGNTSSI